LLLREIGSVQVHHHHHDVSFLDMVIKYPSTRTLKFTYQLARQIQDQIRMHIITDHCLSQLLLTKQYC